jgi:hypothetical protein
MGCQGHASCSFYGIVIHNYCLYFSSDLKFHEWCEPVH